MVTFQFIPYQEIETLSSAKRINKLLNVVKQDKIVVLQGRLTKQEEIDLIEITMEDIDNNFKGIELSVIYPNGDYLSGWAKLRNSFVNMILGDRQGMTIIGPASIVRKIEQNPSKIELFLEGNDKKKRRTKKKSKKRKSKK